MVKCHNLIEGLSFSSSNRSRVAITLHQLCIEHHTGIHTLIDNGVIGSALALFRPQFEAFVRGAWYHQCADEIRLTGFITEAEKPPKIRSMIEDLEKTVTFDNGVLGKLVHQNWTYWNDLTHGGAIQVKARNSENEIVPSYKPGQIANILDSSAKLSMIAGIGIAQVVGLESLVIKLNDEFLSLYEKAS